MKISMIDGTRICGRCKRPIRECRCRIRCHDGSKGGEINNGEIENQKQKGRALLISVPQSNSVKISVRLVGASLHPRSSYGVNLSSRTDLLSRR
jgi:hypothetical protein